MAICNDLKNILKYLFFLRPNLYHGIKMFKSQVPDIFGKNIHFLCILRSQFCLQYKTINRNFFKHGTHLILILL